MDKEQSAFALHRFDRNAMLHLQMNIPSLRSSASLTAALRTEEDVLMDLKAVVDLPETHYQKDAFLKYGCWQPPSTRLYQEKTD